MRKPAPRAVRDAAAADELQLILLSRFLKGRSADDVPGHWTELLSESPHTIVLRYIKHGDLVRLPIARIVEHCCKVPELKQHLKARALKTGGNKQQLAERLVAADEAAMSSLYGARTIVECSPETRIRVEKYLAEKRREYAQLLVDAEAALRARDFAKASDLVGEYESKQLRTDPPNPMAIPADPRDASVDAAALKKIFAFRPKLLRALPETDWEPLHVVAGLNYLLGGRVSGEALPADFVGLPHLDRHTIARMMHFGFKHLQDLERIRSIGVREAEIMTCGLDSCEPCRKLAGRRFRLEHLPELPYEHCTCEVGCRCLITAVIPGLERR